MGFSKQLPGLWAIGETQTHPNAGVRDGLFREVLNNRTPLGGARFADAKTACGRGFGIFLPLKSRFVAVAELLALAGSGNGIFLQF
jgi:hypothetical protein